MSTKTEEKVEQLKEQIDITPLERLNYRLSDAIREGASVTKETVNWGSGDTACALHAAVIAAKARGYLKS